MDLKLISLCISCWRGLSLRLALLRGLLCCLCNLRVLLQCCCSGLERVLEAEGGVEGGVGCHAQQLVALEGSGVGGLGFG